MTGQKITWRGVAMPEKAAASLRKLAEFRALEFGPNPEVVIEVSESDRNGYSMKILIKRFGDPGFIAVVETGARGGPWPINGYTDDELKGMLPPWSPVQ